MEDFLTIVIPTFNRNDKLFGNLKYLLPQLINGIRILILDNCSIVPVSKTLQEILIAFPQITVQRNEFNIGGHGNFIKGFSTVKTKWMWLLGDDDMASIDAVSIILKCLENNPSIGYINFSAANGMIRNKSIIYSSKEDLINGLDDFGNFLFISVGVYNLEFIKKGIIQMYEYAYSHAPQIAIILYIFDIDPTFKVMLSEEIIIAKNLENTTSWSWINVSMGISTVYDFSNGLSKYAKRTLMKHIRTHVRTPYGVYKILLSSNFENNDYERSLYLYDQIFFRGINNNIGVKRLFTYLFYRIVILFRYLKFRM